MEPLRRHGVKAYSTAFLSPDEVLGLGVDEDADGQIRTTQPRWLEERELFEAQALELRAELENHRAHSRNLEQELEAYRTNTAALEQDRDAWKERAQRAEAQASSGSLGRMKKILGRGLGGREG